MSKWWLAMIGAKLVLLGALLAMLFLPPIKEDERLSTCVVQDDLVEWEGARFAMYACESGLIVLVPDPETQEQL